jgi:hypothetical protein
MTKEMLAWWRRLLCALRAHGGITDVRYYSNRTATGMCKKCGAEVTL